MYKFEIGGFLQIDLLGIVQNAIMVDVDKGNYIIAVDGYFGDTFIMRNVEEFDKLPKPRTVKTSAHIVSSLKERYEIYQSKKKWHEL